MRILIIKYYIYSGVIILYIFNLISKSFQKIIDHYLIVIDVMMIQLKGQSPTPSWAWHYINAYNEEFIVGGKLLNILKPMKLLTRAKFTLIIHTLLYM